MGQGNEWGGRVMEGKFESGIYCSIRVHMPYQYTSASEYGIWCGGGIRVVG